MPVLLDLTHTSHTRARTGIQRVTRSLQRALGSRAISITYDPHLGGWRALQSWEHANLTAEGAAAKRSAAWPVSAKIRGRFRRLTAGSAGAAGLQENGGLVAPEVFSPRVGAALPVLFRATGGPRVALFHDAIALKLPELTPAKTVARFPLYLQELLAFDGIAAVSNDSRDSLTDYWRWLGTANIPPVTTIPLGVDRPATAESSATTPMVLCVGSLEARKNHRALLRAADELWSRGVRFELHLIGLAQSETGRQALQSIRALQAQGRALRYDGAVGDAALDAAYARCTFTVYPSLMEGFGLPIIESLARGKPCICSGVGALGESAAGGGCVSLAACDAPALAAAMDRLLRSPAEVTVLADAARRRSFRTWSNYADDLLAWMATLSRRS